MANALIGEPVPPSTARGGGHQHEFPSVQPGGRFGERFQVLVVEQVYPHRHDRQNVHRKPDTFDLRGDDVCRRITAEECHVSCLDPRHG